MPFSDFKQLVLTGKADDYEVARRLFNRLGKRYIKAYGYAVEKLEKTSESDFFTYEMWLRIHLIIDHISGMTDEFALETYQMLEGINLLRV